MAFAKMSRALGSYRIYMQALHSVRVGRFYDLAVAVLYLTFCAVYIVNTAYLSNSPKAMDEFELSLAVLFLFCWLVEMFAASSRLRYFITARSLFNLLSIIPVFASVNEENSYVGGGDIFPYIYPTRFIACYVMLASCLVRGDESLLAISQLKLSISRLLLAIMFLTLTTAAFMQIIVIKSAQVKTLNFFESFFYTIIVLFTVGYVDDVLPNSVFARVVLLVAIVFGAVYIPAKVADIYTLVQEQSSFNGRFVGFSKEELRDGYNHVVVCGVWRSAHLRNFVRRLLALGGGTEMSRAKVVILGKAEPDEELLDLLHDPLYVDRVVYIKGSVLHVPDCHRACLDKAKAVFILSDNHKASPNRMDAEVIMRAVAIHHYDPMARILVKLQMPQNLFHLTWGGVEQVVCVDELKMGLLAQSCLCPGFATLLYTMGCPYIGDDANAGDHREKEFVYGAEQELYVETTPDYFIGKTFASMAQHAHQRFSAVLLAVAVPSDHAGPGRLELQITPLEYHFTGDEQLLFLATSSRAAEAISALTRQSKYPVETKLQGSCCTDDESTPLLARQSVESTHSSSHRLTGSQGQDIAVSRRSAKVQPAAQVASASTAASSKQTVNVCDPVMDGKSRSFIKQLVDSDLAPVVTPGSCGSTDSTDGKPGMSWEFICSGKPRSVKLLESPWSLKNHIILCDNSDGFPRNLGFFIAPLRGLMQSQCMPVVILNPSLPSADQWKLLSSFTSVYFVQGSPLEAGDLKRAAIATASRTVMASDSTIDTLQDPEHTVDAISLLAAHNIHSLAKQSCYTINELIQSSNMDLLIPRHSIYFRTVSPNHAKEELSLPFMSGRAFSSSMLDSLLCSAHTNPLLLSFLRTLLFSGCVDHDTDTDDGDTDADADADGPATRHSSGGLVMLGAAARTETYGQTEMERDGQPTSSALHHHMRRAKRRTVNSSEEDSAGSSGGDDNEDDDSGDSVDKSQRDTPGGVLPQRVVDPFELFEDSPVYQEQCLHSLPKVRINLKDTSAIRHVPIPSHLVGSTYGNVFQYCLKSQSSVALGLWRVTKDRLHYVATNPRPETVIDASDAVFALKGAGS